VGVFPALTLRIDTGTTAESCSYMRRGMRGLIARILHEGSLASVLHDGRLLRASRTGSLLRAPHEGRLPGTQLSSGYDFPYWFKSLAALGCPAPRVLAALRAATPGPLAGRFARQYPVPLILDGWGQQAQRQGRIRVAARSSKLDP